MGDIFDNSKPDVRKSDILYPEYPPCIDDNAYTKFGYSSKSPQLKINGDFESLYSSTQEPKVRDELISERNSLDYPILPKRNRVAKQKRTTKAHSSSVGSINTLTRKRTFVNCWNLASKLSSILTIVGFSAQILCFVLVLLHIDYKAYKQAYGIVLTVSAIGIFGVAFGLWSLLGNFRNSPKRYACLACGGSGCFLLHLTAALAFTLILSEQKLMESTRGLEKDFFRHNTLCVFLASLLVIELLTIITIAGMAWHCKKLKEMESVQQKKSEILSQMAQDLAVS